MTNLTYQELKAIMRKLGFVWFGSRAYDMNVIGIRKNNPHAGKFDDWMYWAYIDTLGFERVFSMPLTTDPMKYYLQNPCNVKGCAILKPGQWRGMWTRGLHRGKQTALIQVKPVTVYRDTNRDDILDVTGKEDTGLFGINFHTGDGQTASAGCQVTPIKADHAHCLELNKAQFEHIGTYSTTYTLLLEQWL